MKRLSIFFLLLILCSSQSFARENKHLKIKANYGILLGSTILADFKKAQITLDIWIKDIFREYDSSIDLKFYQNSEVIYKDFMKDNRLDMILMDAPTFFKYSNNILTKSDNYWSMNTNEYKYKRYYLVSNNKNIKSLEDIQDKTIALEKKDSVGQIWIEKNILSLYKKSLKDVVKVFYYKEASRAILKVFFKKNDLAVVSERTWDTMIELNPALKKKLHIVFQSEDMFIPTIGLFNKKADSFHKEAFFDITQDFKRLPRSGQIATLLKFNGIFKVDKEVFIKLQNFYDEYYVLKREYDK